MTTIKNRRSLVSAILAMFILLELPVYAFSYDLSLDECLDVTAATSLVEDYFYARGNNGNSEILERVASENLVEEEENRLALLDAHNVCILSNEIEVCQLEEEDSRFFVYVDETVAYEANGLQGCEVVEHELILGKYSGKILSDGYREDFSGITSCAYVSPEDRIISVDEALQMIQSTLNNSEDDPCIVSVALSQEGYLEKASNSQLDDFTANAGSGNWTKYNHYFGYNYAMVWCYTFVSWCARHAGVSESVCPTQISTENGWEWYVNNDCAGLRNDYTPEPGDVFFWKAGTKDGHVGLVIGVSGNTVHTIEGNSSNKVRCRSYALTNTSITGYGIHGDDAHDLSDWDYSARYHWRTCGYCDYSSSTQSEHSFRLSGGMYVCRTCGFRTSSIPGINRVGDEEEGA